MVAKKRFIWWKCTLLFALGAAVGNAAADWLPAIEPSGAPSMPAEQFVCMFENPALAQGERVASVRVYPSGSGEEVLLAELVGTQPSRAMISDHRPFVERESYRDYALRKALEQAPKIPGTSDNYSPSDILRAMALSVPLDGHRTWQTSQDFLAAAQRREPTLAVSTAWWAEPVFLKWTSIAVGLGLFGVAGSLAGGRKIVVEEANLTATVHESSPPPSDQTAQIAALDDLLQDRLNAAAPESAESEEAKPRPFAVSIAQYEPGPEASVKEGKEYAGDFYPTERGTRREQANSTTRRQGRK